MIKCPGHWGVTVAVMIQKIHEMQCLFGDNLVISSIVYTDDPIKDIIIVGVDSSPGHRESLSICGKCSRGSFHPFSLTSGQWSWAAVLILAMNHDVFTVDFSGPSDGIRDHEAPHQLGIVAGYSAGIQDDLVACIPCSKCLNNQHLHCYVLPHGP